MFKQGWIGCLFIGLLMAINLSAHVDQLLTLSPELAQRLGQQIWQNECRGSYEGLTSWNAGEEFASLGIGHFIWYPEGRQGAFKETFPALLDFFKTQGVRLPVWLERTKGCPWRSKEAFEQARDKKRLRTLRQLLAEHVDLQILFMVQRLQKALPILVSQLPQEQRAHVTFQFNRLAHSTAGVYALLDYLNFKGEGIKPQERYQEQGWGLLQVLEYMQGTELGQPALQEFVKAAKEVLALRVEHAPPERKEERWLKGWYNRLDTYQQFFINE